MIRILYLIDSLTYGGTEKQLVQLMRHLDFQKFAVHLCTLKPSENLYNELDLPKICLDFPSFGKFSSLGKIYKLVAYIRRHKIDIVQTFFQDPFLLGAMVKPFTPIKLVGSFRDLGFWRTAAESRKMRWAYPFFDGFIANSHAVKTHFEHKDALAPGKIQVIYNGVDCTHIQNQTADSSQPKAPVVGIVANLNRSVKRVQDFILAAGLVYKKFPNARFIVVGDGPLRQELEELGSTAGIREALTFTGRLADPLEAIQSFSVGVITSESEGFCNAMLEYMASGVAVVATDTGGNPELIQPGKNGFLFPVGDVDSLADMIMQIISKPDLQAELAALGRRAVEKMYSPQAMTSGYQEYYQRLLGR